MTDDKQDCPERGSRWTRADYDPEKGPYNGYTVLFITNTAHPSEAHPQQVVYKGDNGHYWSLPLDTWPGNLIPEMSVAVTYCNICKRMLDDPLEPVLSRDCGGDCLQCMALIGDDPDCQRSLVEAFGDEFKTLVRRYARNLYSPIVPMMQTQASFYNRRIWETKES